MPSKPMDIFTFAGAVISFTLSPGGLNLASEIGTATERNGAWAYQTHTAEVRAVARSIGLSPDRPQDLVEEDHFHGKVRRYTQLRYGSENSRRVVVVVDELADGEYEFSVDADRDRRVTKEEIVRGTGRTRTFDLATEIILRDEPQHAMRRVELRLDATITRLNVATLGYMEGSIPWSDPANPKTDKLRVRRIDGNANGLFADSRDRLLIDVNGDGDWDRVSEQFAYLPVLNVAGRRYAVRSNRFGDNFSLSEITGVGQIRVIAAKLPASARVISLEAMVFCDDGSAYSLKQLSDGLSVPVGRYALGSVTMTIDTGEREPWHFVFSRNGSVGERDWISVSADENIALEAVGDTRFELTAKPQAVRPGEGITVQPQLFTQDGLLINLSCRGQQIGSFDDERNHNRCDTKLESSAGVTLSSAQSGFA